MRHFDTIFIKLSIKLDTFQRFPDTSLRSYIDGNGSADKITQMGIEVSAFGICQELVKQLNYSNICLAWILTLMYYQHISVTYDVCLKRMNIYILRIISHVRRTQSKLSLQDSYER